MNKSGAGGRNGVYNPSSRFFVELDLHTKCVVDVDANKVILHPVNTNLSKGDAR